MSEHCKGIKKDGGRCRITANLVDGYCRLHRKQAAAGGVQGGDETLVLERSPQTGIPRYVSCVEDPKKRWIALAVVTVVAVLAVVLTVVFRNHRKND